ncbi:MAG TPA: cytochrome-c peroxidase [Gallionella sp.]|nr:cytochrome-c peroxidase [Gallionella sp.]
MQTLKAALVKLRGYRFLLAVLLAGVVALVWFMSLPKAGSLRAIPFEYAVEAGSEPIAPIPLDIRLDPARVVLGKRLFHEPRLSGDDTVSCANCHGLDRGGADQAVRSFGIGGREGAINAPTVFNSGFNFRQFWDGRAATLEEQIDGPIHDQAEMASNWPQVLGKLRRDGAYRKAFEAIYPDGITADNVKDAIATFERSLYTPNSRFDRYLRGDRAALSGDEQAGYRLFKELGCVSCHQGVNVGGNLYEKMGVMEDYFVARVNVTRADLGRYNQTGIEEQRFEFKVPGLRNVALTAPYFHDGSAATLEQAVRLMAKHQLGIALDEERQRRVVAFLRTLTGEYQGESLK